MPASTDEILSIFTASTYFVLFSTFIFRYAHTFWTPYLTISIVCSLRIATYSIRAYVYHLGQTEMWSPRYNSYHLSELLLVSLGILFSLMILKILYRSILPKVRYVTGDKRGKFEATLVDRTPWILSVIFIVAAVGGWMTTQSNNNPGLKNSGEILRKVTMILYFIIGLVYLLAAWVYKNRYPENKYPFKICQWVTIFFVISMVFKIICTYRKDLQDEPWVFFVFSPLLEILSLSILTVDLQKHFLGRPEDNVPSDEDDYKVI